MPTQNNQMADQTSKDATASSAPAEGAVPVAWSGDRTADHAAQYAEAGFNIIRLYGFTDDGRCDCPIEKHRGCSSAGKHPIDKKAERPNFVEDVEAFEGAISTGAFRSGYGVLLDNTQTLVVDIDARNGGLKSFQKLVREIPEISGCSHIVETGSGNGSRHMFFRVPADKSYRSAVRAYPGIDFKTSGWVVGAGSRHASGGLYRAALGGPDDIDDAPDALIALIEQAKRNERSAGEEAVPAGEVADVVKQALDVIPVGEMCRGDWIAVGATVQYLLGDTGFDLWDRWSAKDPIPNRYNPNEMLKQWDSLSDMDGDLSHLLALAQRFGIPADSADDLFDPFLELRLAIDGGNRSFKAQKAAEMWAGATPVADSPAASWLSERGFHIPDPQAVRYSAESNCLVSLLPSGGINRTYLGGGEDRLLGPSNNAQIDLGALGGEVRHVVYTTSLRCALWMRSRLEFARIICLCSDRHIGQIEDGNTHGVGVSFVYLSQAQRAKACRPSGGVSLIDAHALQADALEAATE